MEGEELRERRRASWVKYRSKPAIIRRKWLLMCEKSRSFSMWLNSDSKGAICSLKISSCLMRNNWPSMSWCCFAMARLANCTRDRLFSKLAEFQVLETSPQAIKCAWLTWIRVSLDQFSVQDSRPPFPLHQSLCIASSKVLQREMPIKLCSKRSKTEGTMLKTALPSTFDLSVDTESPLSQLNLDPRGGPCLKRLIHAVSVFFEPI